MARPLVVTIEFWVKVLYWVTLGTPPAGSEPRGLTWMPGWAPAMVFPGPTVLWLAPAAKRIPNELLPTTVPLRVTPIRLFEITESWVPLSARIPPQPEFTI